MINRRSFLAGMAPLPILYWLKPRAGITEAPRAHRTLVTFGSCNEQYKAQPIWRSIASLRPDLFIFCGDNVYCDTMDMKAMQAAYAIQAANPDWADFRKKVPVVATWDDHDYGGDDEDELYPYKKQSKELFLNFCEEPASSSRRQRDGVYTSYTLGEPGRRVQVILLDLRWFKKYGGGLLGDEQWTWLEQQLRSPADVRLFVSSSQFAARGTQWDKWDDHPQDKARFLKLVDDLDLRNLVVLSGDMHYGEFSHEFTPGGIELIDFTSSGLNRFESAEGIHNGNRISLFDTGENFGVVDIDWDANPIQISLELRNIKGQTVLKHLLKVNVDLNTVS